MTLSAGTKLGPYEILAPIGVGGMGEVYRAVDSRLRRDVAIKVSAERFSDRFLREARAVAALNHPNICTLHDVGPNYLVMELVEGPTLAERIAKDAIPLEEALRIARQIADGLEAAHEKGIVHRDLKPANIKLKSDGVVKILDFGLASRTVPVNTEAGAVNAPTLTMEPATRAGVVLGTAGYMAPEQALGKPVDKRADIWAFGVVLYEMVTGERLFEGESLTETMAALLETTPDFDRLPGSLRVLLRRCLERDPGRRLRDIGDALPLVELSEASAPARRLRDQWLWPGLAVITMLIAAVVSVIHFREKPPAPPEVVRFSIPMREQMPPGYVAVAPDGRKVAFTAGGAGDAPMWVHSFDSLQSRVLAGTEAAVPPIWSYDSRKLAFWAGGKLKKIDISGGPALDVCDIPGVFVGGFWTRDDVIVYGSYPTGPLMRVSAAGGVPVPMTALNTSHQERNHFWPVLLPDQKHFLYYRVAAGTTGLYVRSLDAKPEAPDSRNLGPVGLAYGYIASPDPDAGWVLLGRDNTLIARPFDARHLEFTSEPTVVAERVGTFHAAVQASASVNGVVVYGAGGSEDIQLTWVDRNGKVLGPAGDPGRYPSVPLALSPDATRVAITRGDPTVANLWLLDLSRGSSSRLTFGSYVDQFPVWSPDGRQIAFASTRGGMYVKAADGTGEEQLLARAGRPFDWSRDQRYLLYGTLEPKTKSDLWVLPLARGAAGPVPFLVTESNETFGALSPDGRWIAYASDESGRDEIYVRPFNPSIPGIAPVTGKWMISREGGTRPRWRRDGKEIYFLAPDGKVMASGVTVDPVFRPGVPRTMVSDAANLRLFDAAPDGSKFLLGSVVAQATQSLTVVMNSTAMLRK
jgi:eukaryotic-like serine/threonine-protein kinase